ncbi:conjugal transfer protein, partial [Parabacteroides merdae]|nr:conjugal transfer protein [Parabacteroides merdae]
TLSATLLFLIGGYLVRIVYYLCFELNNRKKRAEKAEQILPRMAVDVSDILVKSTFSLSHSTPQIAGKNENEK